MRLRLNLARKIVLTALCLACALPTQADKIVLKNGRKIVAFNVTEDATKVSPVDHEQLRNAGFDDRGILQITLIAAWFNYINRVADALGVGRE